MGSQVIAGMRAVVTGGARGIGLATTEALLREGVQVVVADLDLDVAEAAIAGLRGIGPAVHARALDVRDGPAFARLVAELEDELGPVDILINNAGIMSVGPFLEQDPLLDDRQIDVNLRGVIHGMRAVLPRMLRRDRGHVVNIASAAGRVGVPGISTYSATKHAVVGLTEAVRHECEGSAVRLSYVLPSIVKTELTAGTRRMRYPPPVEAADVAAAVVECLRTGQVDVFVPRFSRISVILPALLPRRVVERIGEWFGVRDMFDQVDDGARAAYRARITR
jgi:short-subunit dehydrogenase